MTTPPDADWRQDVASRLTAVEHIIIASQLPYSVLGASAAIKAVGSSLTEFRAETGQALERIERLLGQIGLVLGFNVDPPREGSGRSDD